MAINHLRYIYIRFNGSGLDSFSGSHSFGLWERVKTNLITLSGERRNPEAQ